MTELQILEELCTAGRVHQLFRNRFIGTHCIAEFECCSEYGVFYRVRTNMKISYSSLPPVAKKAYQSLVERLSPSNARQELLEQMSKECPWLYNIRGTLNKKQSDLLDQIISML